MNDDDDDVDIIHCIILQADSYEATGCYNLLCSGFVQTNSKIAIGAAISPTSSYKGGQFDISILIWKVNFLIRLLPFFNNLRILFKIPKHHGRHYHYINKFTMSNYDNLIFYLNLDNFIAISPYFFLFFFFCLLFYLQ